MWSYTVQKTMQRNLIIISQSVLHGPKVYDKTIQRNLINILKTATRDGTRSRPAQDRVYGEARAVLGPRTIWSSIGPKTD
jgi:hypothetical protein